MNKKTLPVIVSIIVSLSACLNDQKNNLQVSNKDKIMHAFREWQAGAVKQEKYCPSDSCNPSYFTNHNKNEKLQEGLGLPDSTKFRCLFVDINNDNQMDALITFHPICCTCSDTTGKVVPQAQVIVISNGNKYEANDTFFYHLFSDSSDIHIDVDSAASNYFYGTYFKIGKQDTSVDQYQKSISIAYDTKEIKFIKRGKNKNVE
jgi:hypothetical protein